MDMGPVGFGTKNNFASEGQQQFTRPDRGHEVSRTPRVVRHMSTAGLGTENDFAGEDQQ
jgi:hypothetical protein